MRFIGVDYSGAQTPTSSLPGLRVYQATPTSEPVEVLPPPSPRKYWTRKEIAQWLIEQLSEHEPMIIGIDHAFSFPLAYFQHWEVAEDWRSFAADLEAYWPTAGDNTYVEFIRDQFMGDAKNRFGSPKWRRYCEQLCGAKSVFHFDVPGSVAKSTLAGIPWLRRIAEAHPRLHVWPYDGWDVPRDASVIAEAYPSLYERPQSNRTPDQDDAYAIAAWLRDQYIADGLHAAFHPPRGMSVPEVLRIEGWILGVR